MSVKTQPRSGRLWSSAEAAHAFRVGVSSIKRWTDEGELEAVKTPGGHRRYTLNALYRFASVQGLAIDLLPPPGWAEELEELPPRANVTLYQALLEGDGAAVRELIQPRVNDLAKRATFFDRVVGDALREIGQRWERGELTVDQEHRASYLLSESLESLRPATVRSSRLALLTCPPGEWHDLPLRLVRLILEWAGWRTEFSGANLPWDAMIAAVDRLRPNIVAITSRSGSAFDGEEFAGFLHHCELVGSAVIAGGEWARGGVARPRGYIRFRTLRGFERWLRPVADRSDQRVT